MSKQTLNKCWFSSTQIHCTGSVFLRKTHIKKQKMSNAVLLTPCLIWFVTALVGCTATSYTKTSDDVSTNPQSKIQRTEQLKSAETLTLASGKKVLAISITNVIFPNGDPPALQLRYLTDLSVDGNPAELKSEAEQVWKIFERRVEGAGKATGLITAQERVAHGNEKQRSAFTFGWRKDSDNNWKQLSKN